MSKTRQSDLRSFFNRTPKTENNVSKAETPSRKRNDEIKLVAQNDDMEVSESSPIKSPFSSSVKRRRVVISSDEEDEFEPTVSQTTPKNQRGKENCVTFVDDADAIANIKDSGKFTPVSTPKRNQHRPPTTPKSGSVSVAHSFINSFRFDEELDASERPLTSAEKPAKFLAEKASDDNEVESRFAHLDYDFLKPEKIRDVRGHALTDPDYDPKTLHVPDAFLRQQTPALTQWWKFKSEHFDTILFFKVGKFYELYHMDAVAAVEALNLTYMRGGKHAHCGFPEIGYGRFADQMVNRGYKVARIEQTETPQQLEERCRRTNVREKVVRREVCRLTTFATRTYGILDGTDERETDGVTEPEANYLMAITERSDDPNGPSIFGVCFVDCSTGKFYLSQFSDDSNFTSLRTLIAHNHPSQLLFERDALTRKSTALLNALLVGVPQQALFPEREFWGAEKTLTKLNESIYFAGDWPSVFVENGMIEKESDVDAEDNIPAPCAEYVLAFSALGAIVWYLKECKIDVDLLTMRNFEVYIPSNVAAAVATSGDLKGPAGDLSADSYWRGRNMVLDGTSLLNLHVLPEHTLSRRGACIGTAFDVALQKFSLFNTVNHCATSFGRRLLQRWMCLPSCDARVLCDRQDAVRTITSDWQTYGAPFVEMLRKVPDMERLFQRIHTLGLKHRAVDHPDSRAQLFDSTRYNQRKIKDLVLSLDGLDTIAKIQTTFVKHGLTGKSTLLDQCMSEKNEEMLCDLNYFKRAFDKSTALQDGVIVPSRGVDLEYDEAKDSVRECERVLDDYLEKQRVVLKCSSIKYLTGGKANYYHIEMPDSACSKIGSDYTFISQRKGFKRYTTKELEDLKTQLSEAQSKLNIASDEVTRKVFSDFDERKQKWCKVVENIAIFDCLLSLAHYAEYAGLKMCFPEFVFDALEPFLEIRAGYHPALLSSRASGSSSVADNAAINYIPNDCILGGDSQSDYDDSSSNEPVDARKPVMLLTGPNMGGKSTLMRQISSLVVLAQMGSMVPADSMRLTPVDRIFCRIGASDRLTAGQSTFFVELLETNVILREATPHSLVLVDELGRGTSTYDGTAIAFAVLKQIAGKIRCRTIFSTHYHALCRMVRDNTLASGFMKRIKLAHMACMAENETNDPTEQNITFLYTLSGGPASKSYGFYTAKVAGIDKDVVRRAFAASNRLKSC